jgi:hypothetical protein
MHFINGAGGVPLLGILICALPALLALVFAIRPTERLLALLRPLTMAGVFSALCGFVLALTNGFATVATTAVFDAESIRRIGAVCAEGMAPVAASLALLTVAWGCATVGMRRL